MIWRSDAQSCVGSDDAWVTTTQTGAKTNTLFIGYSHSAAASPDTDTDIDIDC